MIKHTKKLLTQSLKILFSAGIIYWLISSGKLNFSALRNLLSPGIAAAALSLICLNLFLASERWRILLESQSIKTSSWELMKLSLIGNFFNYAMPGGIGGDVIKAYYFTKQNAGAKVIAITSVLMDRILGLYSMIIMAMIVMLFDMSHISQIRSLLTLFWIISSLFISFSAGLALVFSQFLYRKKILTMIIARLPMSDKLLKLYESMRLYGNQGHRVLNVIFFSLLSQASAIIFLYLVGLSTGYTEVSLKTYFLVAPLGFMATAVPISPAGVGVGQAAFYFLFNLYTSETTDLGPIAITALQVGTFLVSLLGAFFYMRFKEQSDLSNAEIF